MSRAQQGQVLNTASGENSTYDTNAQNAFKSTEGDLADYSSELGAFDAANPYVQGGSVQTAQNQELADTASSLAKSSGQALQGAAVRTGQNAGGAIAAQQQMEEQNDRDLMSAEANATANRAGAGAAYTETGLQGRQNIVNAQDQLATQQASAAQGALGTEEQAANTPNFAEELMGGVLSAGTGFAQGFGSSVGKGCWIAAELYGGWNDWRTVRLRTWIFGEFAKSRMGATIAWLYTRCGERLARIIRWNRPLRWVMQRVFDAALRKAVKDAR